VDMSTPFPRNAPSSGFASGSKRSSSAPVDDALFGSKRLKRVETRLMKGDKPNQLQKSGGSGLLAAGMGLGMVKASGGEHNVMKIENLTFSKYTVGVLAMGYVLSLTKTHVIVSLPGGVTGSVIFSELSDVVSRFPHIHVSKKSSSGGVTYPSIDKLIAPLEPVQVYVLGSVDGGDSARTKKTLQLSMRLSLVHRGLALKHMLVGGMLPATVSSVEDEGYVMSAGIPGVTFFMPMRKVPASLGRLVLGRTIRCVIDNVNENSRAVILRAHPKSVREALTFGAKLGFTNLMPGNLVTVVVDKVVQVSISCLFCILLLLFLLYALGVECISFYEVLGYAGH